MKLCAVTLEKTDTCLTYALRRIGLPSSYCTLEDFHDYFDQRAYKIKKLNVGDILLWDKTAKWKWMGWEITEEGVIVYKNVQVETHFSVYEGDGLISDVTRTQNTPYPSLRMRKLADVQKNPDWILTISKS